MDDRGETFFTPAEAAGGLEMRLTRVLRPKATFPPVDAAPETELLPDLSTSDIDEGGRDSDEAGRAGIGVLKDETDAIESLRVAREAVDEGTAGVVPAVPLTPMLRLSCDACIS